MTVRVLTAPKSSLKPGANLDGMTKYASPVAIRAHLKDVRAAEARWRKLGDKLEAMLAERLAQVEAGTWPPAPTEEQLALRARFQAAGSATTKETNP